MTNGATHHSAATSPFTRRIAVIAGSGDANKGARVDWGKNASVVERSQEILRRHMLQRPCGIGRRRPSDAGSVRETVIVIEDQTQTHRRSVRGGEGGRTLLTGPTSRTRQRWSIVWLHNEVWSFRSRSVVGGTALKSRNDRGVLPRIDSRPYHLAGGHVRQTPGAWERGGSGVEG